MNDLPSIDCKRTAGQFGTRIRTKLLVTIVGILLFDPDTNIAIRINLAGMMNRRSTDLFDFGNRISFNLNLLCFEIMFAIEKAAHQDHPFISRELSAIIPF